MNRPEIFTVNPFSLKNTFFHEPGYLTPGITELSYQTRSDTPPENHGGQASPEDIPCDTTPSGFLRENRTSQKKYYRVVAAAIPNVNAAITAAIITSTARAIRAIGSQNSALFSENATSPLLMRSAVL